MLSGLVEPLATGETSGERTAELFADVLPAFFALKELGDVNLIEYASTPAGTEGLLPPFTHTVPGPEAPSDLMPSLHVAESQMNWIPVAEQVSAHSADAEDIVVVSNTLSPFELAAEKGWITIWLNRDRVANLTGIVPDAEIHTLLDLPEALETYLDARALTAGL